MHILQVPRSLPVEKLPANIRPNVVFKVDGEEFVMDKISGISLGICQQENEKTTKKVERSQMYYVIRRVNAM